VLATGEQVKARGQFPAGQAALNGLYLVTRSRDPTGRGQARWMMRWKPSLNAFPFTFADHWSAAVWLWLWGLLAEYISMLLTPADDRCRSWYPNTTANPRQETMTKCRMLISTVTS
jgi:hypothetical protein